MLVKYSINSMHEQMLIIRVVARHRTDETVILRRVPLEITRRGVQPVQPQSYISVSQGPVLAIVDLEIRRVGIQGVAQDEIHHDQQRSAVDAEGQFLAVGILRKDLHPLDSGVRAGVSDGVLDEDVICQGCCVLPVDGAVACRCVHVVGGAGFHGVLRGVVGAVEAGPEDGCVGALVVAVGA